MSGLKRRGYNGVSGVIEYEDECEAEDEPYRSLARAVIFRALADAYGDQNNLPGREKSQTRGWHIAWAKQFINDQSFDPQSFNWWCEIGRFDPIKVRIAARKGIKIDPYKWRVVKKRVA